MFGFGITDGATPNAFNWGTDEVFNKLGAGRLSSSDGGVVTYRWKRCYEIISRGKLFVGLYGFSGFIGRSESQYSGETHFLRGLAYSVLAETYGGVTYYIDEHFHGRSS